MTGTPTGEAAQVTMRTLIENRLCSCLLLVIATLASTPVLKIISGWIAPDVISNE
jgi:hypothetical protein